MKPNKQDSEVDMENMEQALSTESDPEEIYCAKKRRKLTMVDPKANQE